VLIAFCQAMRSPVHAPGSFRLSHPYVTELWVSGAGPAVTGKDVTACADTPLASTVVTETRSIRAKDCVGMISRRSRVTGS
jgi:hypothetical protein